MIPIHHLSEALVTTVQPGADALAVTPAAGSEGSQALSPMSSPAHHSETPPLPILPLSDIPYIGTPQKDVHLLGLSLIPSIQSGIASPMVHPRINLGRGPMLKPLKLKPAVGTAHCGVAKNHLKHHQKCMTMVWVPLRVPKSTTGTALIMVVKSEPRMN